MAEILKQSKTYLVLLSQDELDVLGHALGARVGVEETERDNVAHKLFEFFHPHRDKTLRDGDGTAYVEGTWKFVR